MNKNDTLIQIHLQSARDRDAKREVNWANTGYSSALITMLSKSLVECDNAEAGIQCICLSGGRECLQNFRRTQAELLAEVEAKKWPWSVIGGNYKLLVAAHVATLLGDSETTRECVNLANFPEVLELSTKFWRSYAHGALCLMDKRSFQIPVLKLRGLENYWLKYMHLMQLRVIGGDLTACLREIDEGFAKRNSDKRIKDDSDEIEGSGQQPVRWDFRREAIMKLPFS